MVSRENAGRFYMIYQSTANDSDFSRAHKMNAGSFSGAAFEISPPPYNTPHTLESDRQRGAARRVYARVGKKLSVCEGSAKKRKLTAKTIITYSMLGSGDNFRRFFVARNDIKRAHEERMVKTDSFSCEKHQESRCCQFAPCQPRSSQFTRLIVGWPQKR